MLTIKNVEKQKYMKITDMEISSGTLSVTLTVTPFLKAMVVSHQAELFLTIRVISAPEVAYVLLLKEDWVR